MILVNKIILFLVGSGAGARVVMIPRGINCKPWIAELQKPLNRARISELRERLKGRKVKIWVKKKKKILIHALGFVRN
jgi:hypothetical protein